MDRDTTLPTSAFSRKHTEDLVFTVLRVWIVVATLTLRGQLLAES